MNAGLYMLINYMLMKKSILQTVYANLSSSNSKKTADGVSPKFIGMVNFCYRSTVCPVYFFRYI